MSKVFISMGVSADGFIAGPDGGPANPMGGAAPFIHDWVFDMHAFRSRLGMEGGQTEGEDNAIVENIFTRCGAYVLGKRMFDEGEASWPADAPFRAPVYVLTHAKRGPWERPGGTVFHFTDESLRDVLAKARKDAGGKDVRISGGANVVRQYLNAGLVDELIIHQSPSVIGSGVRLLEGLDRDAFSLEIERVVSSPRVTHMFYKVHNK
ncbi:dihydrofolate reductase family protein [Chitinophaga caseinilytica]|uniref:Dihydrofolate reductase family protein n=1 Tax=Chitinophaga caseinilytica TaxID=2267521 RepID=A0ABZ2Z1G3_9BACT